LTFDDSGSLILERNELQGMRMSGKALANVIDSAQGSMSCLARPAGHQQSYRQRGRSLSGIQLPPSTATRLNRKAMSAYCWPGRPKSSATFAHNDFRLFVAGANPESFGNGGLNVVPI
jgi:hypothetical protein